MLLFSVGISNAFGMKVLDSSDRLLEGKSVLISGEGVTQIVPSSNSNSTKSFLSNSSEIIHHDFHEWN